MEQQELIINVLGYVLIGLMFITSILFSYYNILRINNLRRDIERNAETLRILEQQRKALENMVFSIDIDIEKGEQFDERRAH